MPNPNQDGMTQNTDKPCKPGIKHMLMMVACCMAPLAGAFILNSMGYGGPASFLVMLLCPLMHLFMMRGGHGGKAGES